MIDLYIKESNAIEEEFSDIAHQDSLAAWEWLKKQPELNSEVILGLHGIMLQTLNPTIAGEFRECKVFIGGHEGADWRAISQLLKLLCKLDPKNPVEIVDWHVAYEAIHPFADGNGRTGRLLMYWQFVKKELQPVMFMNETKHETYYPLFQRGNQ